MAKLGDAIDSLVSYLQRPTSRGRIVMVLYPPPVERRVQKQLVDIVGRVKGTGLKVSLINVNSIVNSAIEARFTDIIEAWQDRLADAKRAVTEPSRKQLINETIAAASNNDVVIWTRVGGAYPFLSIASSAEQCIGKLSATLVILYPGSLEGKTSFRLLDKRDGYQYRLDHLEVVDA